MPFQLFGLAMYAREIKRKRHVASFLSPTIQTIIINSIFFVDSRFLLLLFSCFVLIEFRQKARKFHLSLIDRECVQCSRLICVNNFPWLFNTRFPHSVFKYMYSIFVVSFARSRVRFVPYTTPYNTFVRECQLCAPHNDMYI